MSVGYDLEGIQSEKVDGYIEGMKDASGSAVWQECMDWTLANLDRFQQVDEAYVKGISPKVSRSITESTLHGCPPDEIERIATHLITEQGAQHLHQVQPHPAGLRVRPQDPGQPGLRLHPFDDHHFREDLQWEDAVPMFRRLHGPVPERGLEFGVKLTNTFPVDVAAGELPSEEMYMSGRSLFPLTISLAAGSPTSSTASCASPTPAAPTTPTSRTCSTRASGPSPWPPPSSSPAATSA